MDTSYLHISSICKDYKAFFPTITRGLGNPRFRDVPLHDRVLYINSFIYLRVYFYDLLWPMLDADIAFYEKQLKRYIGRISIAKCHAYPLTGGLNFINLAEQLKGKRAKMIYPLFFPSDNWGPVVLRDKIQFFLDMHTAAHHVPRYQFLFGHHIQSSANDARGHPKDLQALAAFSSIFSKLERFG